MGNIDAKIRLSVGEKLTSKVILKNLNAIEKIIKNNINNSELKISDITALIRCLLPSATVKWSKSEYTGYTVFVVRDNKGNTIDTPRIFKLISEEDSNYIANHIVNIAKNYNEARVRRNITDIN